jgi:K+ transporter
VEVSGEKTHFAIDEVKNRYPGIGVFYCYNPQKIPQSFLKLTHQLHTIPENLVFLIIEVVNEPFVPDDKRVSVVTEDDIHMVTVK